MKKIPIVFAFDGNYALPASIAIKSLTENKNTETEYEIIIFHNGLSQQTKSKMAEICSVRWIEVDETILNEAPSSYRLPLSVYYRLFIANLLPEYDKVIWSDVDVLFKGDLSSVYNTDMQGYDWAGVVAEKQSETNGVHTHFPENNKEFIYMSGFMVVNTKLWREKKMLNRFLEIIKTYENRLKMFDLDVLNLASDKIKAVPFEYCVLENIYDNDNIKNAPEYPWLSNVYSDEDLIKAKQYPMIIHYAGAPVKIWKRKFADIPEYYRDYITSSSFYDKAFYFPDMKRKTLVFLITVLQKLCFVKKYRNKLKRIKKNLVSR